MRGGSSALLGLVASAPVLLGATGCLTSMHQEPDVGEPHAVAMVRLTYDKVPDERLQWRMDVNGRGVRIPRHRSSLSSSDMRDQPPAVVRVRTHPGATTLTVTSWFSHVEETVCSDRSEQGPCFVTVERDECVADTSYWARVGETYRIDYSYAGVGECLVACRVRHPESGELDYCPRGPRTAAPTSADAP